MNHEKEACCASTGCVPQPETLTVISIQTAEILADTEGALTDLIRIIDPGMIEPCDAKRGCPQSFSESVYDLRARSMGLRALANDLLRRFQ